MRPGIPAVVITGNRSAVPEARLAGMAGIQIVDKPFTGEDLVTALQKALGPRSTA